MVAIVGVPQGGNTRGSGALLTLEVSGRLIHGVADADGDGVADATDNCPSIANANQADADRDGAGDACDRCPSDPRDDVDRDGICGNLDNCPSASNPDQADRDANGIGDACEGFRVSFETPTSATPSGFRKDDGTAFSPVRGYGWNGPVETRERVSTLPLELNTFAMSSATRVWTAEVANGDYDVHVSSGDATSAAGPHRVRVQARTAIADVATDASGFLENTVRVPVRDGRLQVAIGGAGGGTTINYLHALPASGAGVPALLQLQPDLRVPPGFRWIAGRSSPRRAATAGIRRSRRASGTWPCRRSSIRWHSRRRPGPGS
jgi:hypothetical protein